MDWTEPIRGVGEHLVGVFTHPLNLTALAMFCALAVLEYAFPARPLPPVRGWRSKGTLFLLLGITISSSTPLLWDAYLSRYTLLDATALGDVGGAIAGFVVYELGVYTWHRAMHASTLLWRVFHQMHHSAERIDVFGAFYFHPLDTVAFSLVTSVSLVGVLGLTPNAAMTASLMLTFCNFFQHANVRTPRWLGYVIQRPESHGVHHARGRHAFNYSDMPLWDVLFGTFRNPAKCTDAAGFYDGASARVFSMLVGRDVSRPHVGRDWQEAVAAGY
ncbi:MAG TPA: sterol desaturase family protein, partial [Candidatus Binatia bacterium]|nr:sterol desaturase family protein [Candidatus Binatia bacterium]